MTFEWRTRRKVTFISFFGALILIITGIVTYILLPAPSCTDGRLNQDEEQIDCGGSFCAPCITERADNLIVLWSRFFEVRPGVYDAAAFVENVNLTLGARDVPYVFELYDAEGARIVSRRSVTYALPNKQFLIFAAGLETGIRTPERMVFRLEPFSWELISEQALPVIVSRSERNFDSDRPRLIAAITNNALYAIDNVDVAVIISDAARNAIGVAEVRIERLPDSGMAEAAFTWPNPFFGTPVHVEFFVRQRP